MTKIRIDACESLRQQLADAQARIPSETEHVYETGIDFAPINPMPEYVIDAHYPEQDGE